MAFPLGYGSNQALCVIILGVMEDFFCAALFNNLTFVHYSYVFAQAAYNSKVMANKKYCYIVFFTQIMKQLEYLLLNGDIQCGGRFVANKKFGTDYHCRGNDCTLTLTA